MKKEKTKYESKIKKLVLFNLAIHQLNKNAELGLKLSLVQFHILKAVLASPGVSAQTLAKNTGVHPSTLTQTMKILIRKGLLFVDENPRDSRMKIILATKAGKHAIDHFNNNIHTFLSEFTIKTKDMNINY